jgi:hypothetical protein
MQPAAGIQDGVCSAGLAAMFEHRGNGEHPHFQERRRQLLVWRSLARVRFLRRH